MSGALQDWQKEALAAAFQYVDQEDFDYIAELLRRSIRHSEDIRPRFWLAVMEGCNSVLHKPSRAAFIPATRDMEASNG